jgi:hypothetical protein
MTFTVTVVEYEATVYCLCGDHATGWVTPGVRREWQDRWLSVHPRGQGGHGPATKEQAEAAEVRRQITWPIDSCAHVWQLDLAGAPVCVREGGCGLTLVDWPEGRPLPSRGADWDRVSLIQPGRLLFRRPD